MSTIAIAAEASASRPATALYRAVWRWHFYAGLLVLPFLLLMATTGALYLFKDEIDAVVYRSYLHVEPSQMQTVIAPSAMIAAARAAYPGVATRLIPPRSADMSAEVGITDEAGRGLSVYVNPYGGEVLGAIPDESKLMGIVRKLHSLDYFGWVANRAIEIVAGWAIVLVVTGFYLWWPRGRSGGVWKPRNAAGRRTFWRDLHAVTGAYVGVVILFLAVTGMPWSGFWGDKVNRFVNENGLGYPHEYWENVPKSTVPMGEALTQTSWSLENAPMPASVETGAAPIGVDRAIAIFGELGVPKGYILDLPGGPEGVYSASAFTDRAAAQRVVHLDQYTGEPLFNAGFAALGAGAKAIEWSISVHMGQEFGLANQLVMLAACLSIIVMAVAALVMWWKRRPKGALGAPPLPANFRAGPVILGIAVAVGIVFPLVGASLLAVLLIDWLLPGSIKRRWA